MENENEYVSKELGIDADAILLINNDGDEFDTIGMAPRFLFYLDLESKNLVLAVRGTTSFKDIMIDVAATEEPFLDGFAHQGILKGARLVLGEVLSLLLKCLQKYPDYGVVVTGHSLGGGTAVLITLILLQVTFHLK